MPQNDFDQDPSENTRWCTAYRHAWGELSAGAFDLHMISDEALALWPTHRNRNPHEVAAEVWERGLPEGLEVQYTL